MLIDSHAHLYDEWFDEDREKIINDLRANGLEIVLNLGCELESSKKCIELADKYDILYAAVGSQPEELEHMNYDTLEKYKSYASHKKVIAIGEIGLDYHYENSPRDIQKKWFREQIRLANELDLPYIVHDREAHEDTITIMKEELKSNSRGILHCYSGSVEMAREFIKMGFYIALGGVVTFKNAKTAKKVAQEIPLEHLLIETDSPYLSPEPYRGKRNEPKNVRYVAEQIAILKNIGYDEVVSKTNSNFKSLFQID